MKFTLCLTAVLNRALHALRHTVILGLNISLGLNVSLSLGLSVILWGLSQVAIAQPDSASHCAPQIAATTQGEDNSCQCGPTLAAAQLAAPDGLRLSLVCSLTDAQGQPITLSGRPVDPRRISHALLYYVGPHSYPGMIRLRNTGMDEPPRFVPVHHTLGPRRAARLDTLSEYVSLKDGFYLTHEDGSWPFQNISVEIGSALCAPARITVHALTIFVGDTEGTGPTASHYRLSRVGRFKKC